MLRWVFLAAAFLAMPGPLTIAQDTDEVKRLKDQLERLRRENEELRKEIERLRGARADPANKDPFAKGANWVGKRSLGGKDADGQKWELTISERKQDSTFKGEMRLYGPKGNAASYPVTGQAPAGDGPVAFLSEKGQFRQEFKGRLKNGQIGVEFIGTSQTGDPVKGTGYLNPKDDK